MFITFINNFMIFINLFNFLFRNKLNVKEAIDYISEAWENVTQTTIRNCWVKTGILPSSDYLVDDINMEDLEINEVDDFDDVDIDLLPEADDLRNYFEMLDHDIPTEERLTNEQIINLLQDEENESEDDGDISDEEALVVSKKKGVEALKTFINYFEQQNDSDFNIDDLWIFRKYLRIIKIREFNSKNQTTLDIFFNDNDKW